MNSSSTYPQGPIARSRAWGLPLLAKELIEAAARPRTFRVRVIYAAIVMLTGLVVLGSSVHFSQLSLVTSLGSGKPVFETLNGLQTIGLYLVLPILACSSLTVEKDRKTLELLLITRLGPWTIVFEKFLGVVVLAVNYLLLSLPVLAFSYSFGGIEVSRLFDSAGEFLLLVIRISAIGVMCSALCASSGRALIATYILEAIVRLTNTILSHSLLYWLSHYLYPSSSAPAANAIDWTLFWDQDSRLADNGIVFGVEISITILSSLLLLTVARLAVVPPLWLTNNWLNRRLIARRQIRDVPLLERSLDFDDPLAWATSPRGDVTRWWVKSYLRATVPIVLIVLLFRLTLDQESSIVACICLSVVIWLVIIVRIISQAASLIVRERIHQTLDVLRCTPISAKSIVRQKLQLVWRTVYISRAALSACVVARSLGIPDIADFLYIAGSALMIWLYPVAIAWLALSCGLTAKTEASAILKALVILGAWCILPVFCCIPFVNGLSLLPLLFMTEAMSARPLWVFLGSELYVQFGVFFLGTFICQTIRISRLQKWVLEQADSKVRTVPEFPEKRPRFGDNNFDRILPHNPTRYYGTEDEPIEDVT